MNGKFEKGYNDLFLLCKIQLEGSSSNYVTLKGGWGMTYHDEVRHRGRADREIVM